uniref:DRY_EERY domain-containing protein n=1 Tax=Steinernema glaseri TaxID=37863 RepID=A0A1I8AAT2_9BILA
MWHEARKQEKKVRSHMVDAVKRNERRKQYYESIRRDPEQFMQVHGRKCHVNLDPAVAQAAESSSTLRKWQGNPDILIDRFDARSHLDYIPEVKQEDEDSWDTLGMHEEETPCDYERYRVLVANDYKKISEKQWLKDIATKEFWGETKNKQNQKAKMEVQRKRQLAEKKAAIGFSYEGSETVVGTSHLPHYSGESDNEGLDEIGFDLKLDVRRMSAEELSALNKIGQQYRVGGTTFIKLKLTRPNSPSLSGRGAKADRAMLKKRRAEIVGKVSQNEEATTTLLSFIAKKNDKKLRLESSSSSEDERVHHERTEFIRSFGGERLDKSGDDSPTRDVVQGPVLPSQEYRKILALKSRRSPSPFSFHEQSTSRKVASSPVRRNRRLRSQSPISPPCNDRTTVAVSDSTTEDAGDDQPLEIRSSMSESEKERVEIENRKRMYRRTKRMARKREKAKDSDSDNERKVFAARKLRQQMQRALTKTATELKAEEEERMRELKERRRFNGFHSKHNGDAKTNKVSFRSATMMYRKKQNVFAAEIADVVKVEAAAHRAVEEVGAPGGVEVRRVVQYCRKGDARLLVTDAEDAHRLVIDGGDARLLQNLLAHGVGHQDDCEKEDHRRGQMHVAHVPNVVPSDGVRDLAPIRRHLAAEIVVTEKEDLEANRSPSGMMA